MSARPHGRILLPLLVVLLAPAWLHAQNAKVYVANSAGDQILSVDFATGDTTVVNTDANKRKKLQGLALRDDGLGGIHLIAADSHDGKVLFYRHPLQNVAGQTISSAVASPDGPSLNAAGDLFLVGSSASSSSQGYSSHGSASLDKKKPSNGPKVYRIRKNGSAPGGYGAAVAIDPNVPSDALEDTEVNGTSLLVLSSTPAKVFSYANAATCTAPCARTVLITVPAGFEPTGMALTPAPNRRLLVTTKGGTVLRFDAASGARVLPDFASGIGNHPRRIAVGFQAGSLRAFVTVLNGGKVLRFRINAGGTGDPEPDQVSDGVQSPVGVDSTTSNTVTTAAGANVNVEPTDLADLTFPQVQVAGLTNGRVFYFEDPRESASSAAAYSSSHSSSSGFNAVDLDLSTIDPSLPPAIIPPYVRAFRQGSPTSGPPIFIVVVMDTNAGFKGPIRVHGVEELVLGYDPLCDKFDDANTTIEGRWFYSPEFGGAKNEPPIFESPKFTDITTGCGSMLGHTRNLSLFLVARDTRPLDGPKPVASSYSCGNTKGGVVDCKLQVLRALVPPGWGAPPAGSFSCVDPSLRGALDHKLKSAIQQFDAKCYPAAKTAMQQFLDAVDDAADSKFATCTKNEREELSARALSAIFFIGKLD